MAELCLLDEDGAIAQRWEIGNHPMAVGRDESAEVPIPDDTLSRRHFLIWQQGEDFLIEDLGSQNGTWVDGQRAKGTKLSHNVCIVAGRTVFMFCEHHLRAGAARQPLTAPSETTLVLPAALAQQAARVARHAVPPAEGRG